MTRSFHLGGDLMHLVSYHYRLRFNIYFVDHRNVGGRKQVPRGYIRCDYLVGTFCSFSFVGWTDRPTDRHFDVINELSLTVSWSMSNFVVIGA